MAWYDVGDLLMKVPLEEVISRLGIKAERRGHQLRAICPFHQDSKPSLNLYPSGKGSPSHFHCFSCGAHGNAIDLVKEVNGTDFKSSIDWLARSFGIQPVRGEPEGGGAKGRKVSAVSFALRQFDHHHDAEKFSLWCSWRGFDEAFLYSKGLRYISTSILVPALEKLVVGEQVVILDGLLELGLIRRLRTGGATRQLKLKFGDQFQDYFNDGRVIIPVYSADQRHAKIVGFAGRLADNGLANAAPKYLLTAGFKKADYLFNANAALTQVAAELKVGQPSKLYLVEGFLDALRLESLGHHAVALMGTSLGKGQFEQLTSFVESAPANAQAMSIVVFLDNDAAGFDGADRLVKDLLGVVGVDLRWVGAPWRTQADIGKDPDSCLFEVSGSGDVSTWLNRYDLPAEAVLLVASLGGKDSSVLQEPNWQSVPSTARERSLFRTAVTIRKFSGKRSLDVTLDRLGVVESHWAKELIRLLIGEDSALSIPGGGIYLNGVYERTALARNLAYFGSRRGELPCDEEAWLTLSGNARLFDQIALDRLRSLIQGRDSHWSQVAPFDAVNLPRKLSDDESVLRDARRKVMPHPADLHVQQLVLNEILTQRHDRLNAAGKTFSAGIPAVRWYSSRREVVVTGPFEALSEPNVHDGEPATLSFGYQVDMDVLEGDKTPSDQGMFRPFGECWRDFMSCLSQQCHAIGSQVHVIRLDAKRYYDSIQRYVVRDRLLAPLVEEFNTAGVPIGFSEFLGPEAGVDVETWSAALERLLMGFLFGYTSKDPRREGDVDRSNETIGIPQGPVISAYIGTIALFPVDDCARRYIRRTSKSTENGTPRPTAGYARYVDDIVIFADSEQVLAEMREALQAEARLSSISLIHKGDRVRAGSPDNVMRQLNEGRGFAASVPGWEPPLVGDGEAGWGLAQDMPDVDRQCALRMLRHPDLITNPAAIYAQVEAAMSAQDLRPNDLGLCARWLWWQVAWEAVDLVDYPSRGIWEEFWKLWDGACQGRDWSIAFKRRGYHWLYAIEGLDRLLDPNPWIEDGQTLLEVPKNRARRRALAEVVCRSEFFVDLTVSENRSHLQRRARLVVTKARRLVAGETLRPPVDAHRAEAITSVEWLCIAAEAINSAAVSGDAAEWDPLNELRVRTSSIATVGAGLELADAVRDMLQGIRKGTGPGLRQAEVLGLSIDFVLNSAPKRNGLETLARFPNLFMGADESESLALIPHLPVADGRTSSLYALEDDAVGSERRIVVYTAPPTEQASRSFIQISLPKTAELERSYSQVEFQAAGWAAELLGVERSVGTVPWRVMSTGDLTSLGRPIQVASILFDALYAVHNDSDRAEGTVYVPFKPQLVQHESEGHTVIHLLAEPVARELLGINAWFHDQDGRVRTISVPKAHADIWRVGWAVADVLGLAAEMSGEAGIREEILPAEVYEGHSSGETAELIEGYILRQQLRKLQGSYISEAQVDVSELCAGRASVPRTVTRALDLLRKYPADEDLASKVRYVIATEAETRAMAFRLASRSAGDLRDQLHLIFPEAVSRLPLWVLQGLELGASATSNQATRPELLLTISLYRVMGGSREVLPRTGNAETAPALRVALALSVASAGLRGCVAALWGMNQGNQQRMHERLNLPAGWVVPDGLRADPQADYSAMRKWLMDADWVALGRATPWHWMLAMSGLLESTFPTVFEDADLAKVFLALSDWRYGASGGEYLASDADEEVWPFDGLPRVSVLDCDALVDSVSAGVIKLDRLLGLRIVRVEDARFRRDPHTDEFTDADGAGWQMAKPQYTSLGPGDVERVVKGRRRLSVWTETRRAVDDELVAVHWLGAKLGSWLAVGRDEEVLHPVALTPRSQRNGGAPSVPIEALVRSESASSRRNIEEESTVDVDVEDCLVQKSTLSNAAGSDVLNEFRELQSLSLTQRRRAEPAYGPSAARASSHFRVALLQLQSQDSYSHPLVEVGIDGLPLGQRARDDVALTLKNDDLGAARLAGRPGYEHLWKQEMDLISWPEHRRRAVLTEALQACYSLGVELLVLPEVSIRKDTIEWMKREMTVHYPGLSVLAGTYRHFSSTDELEHLKEVVTLLWRPESYLAEQLGLDSPSPTVELSRGKKYRSVASHELFKPDLRELGPLYSEESVLEKISELRTKQGSWSGSEVRGLINALVNDSPKLRYCMELVCSELFLLTSPANRRPLEQELEKMLKLFSLDPSQAAIEVGNDLAAVGKLLTFAHGRRERRSVLLVPAHTSRSNDYWHAGQASVLASGTATVFCNAVHGGANGESCFIGIDSVTRTRSDVGVVKLLTPYHGWQKGILQADGGGALSSKDQALLVVDMDPVHVVSGKPRPQLLPEPMALVAYMPIVEVADRRESVKGLSRALVAATQGGDESSTADGGGIVEKVEGLLKDALFKVGGPFEKSEFAKLHRELLEIKSGAINDVEYFRRVERFAKYFGDSESICERFNAWRRDRHQQPGLGVGRNGHEPVWVDFLVADMTCKGEVPSVHVPAWSNVGEFAVKSGE